MKIKEILTVIACVLIGGTVMHLSKEFGFNNKKELGHYTTIQYLKGNFKNAPDSDDSVYVYQGEFKKDNDSVVFSPILDEPSLFPQRMVTIVYDVNGITDKELILNQIEKDAKRWKFIGNIITSVMLNLNIDANNIEEYYTFMQEMNELSKERSEYNVLFTGINNWMTLTNEQIAKISSAASVSVFKLYDGEELVDSLENIIKRLSNIDSYYYIIVKNNSLSKENLKRISENPKFSGIINVIE